MGHKCNLKTRAVKVKSKKVAALDNMIDHNQVTQLMNTLSGQVFRVTKETFKNDRTPVGDRRHLHRTPGQICGNLQQVSEYFDCGSVRSDCGYVRCLDFGSVRCSDCGPIYCLLFSSFCSFVTVVPSVFSSLTYFKHNNTGTVTTTVAH